MSELRTDSERYQVATRRLLRAAIDSSIKYQEICDLVPNEIWNRNSLKQFAFRESSAKPTAKTDLLAEKLIQLFEQDVRLSEWKGKLAPERQLLSLHLGISERHEPRVSKSFRQLSLDSLAASLPERLAFVRFGRERKKMVVVLINFHREESNIVFSMKISGNSKRLIVGQVLYTQPITYLCGLAYPVVSPATDEEFAKMGTSKFDNDPNFLSTPIGIETISVKNSDFLYGVCPASFMGLDGWGNPFTGNGVIIPEGKFGAYDIPRHIVSAVDCADTNTPLKDLLNKAEGETITYPEGGAPGLHMISRQEA